VTPVNHDGLGVDANVGAGLKPAPAITLSSRHGEGQQCDISGPLDGRGQLPLVFRAVSGNPPGYDLAALCNKGSEDIRFLIIHPDRGISAETTDFASGEGTASGRSAHDYSPSFLA
jgi:hypothetical protein